MLNLFIFPTWQIIEQPNIFTVFTTEQKKKLQVTVKKNNTAKKAVKSK